MASSLVANDQTTTGEAMDYILAHIGADLVAGGRNEFSTNLADIGNRTKINDNRKIVLGLELACGRGLASITFTKPEKWAFPFSVKLTPEGQARADRMNNGSLCPGDSLGHFPRLNLVGSQPVIADFEKLKRDGDMVLGLGKAGDVYLLTKVAGKCYAIEFDQVVV